jgi:hypothetical protein
MLTTADASDSSVGVFTPTFSRSTAGEHAIGQRPESVADDDRTAVVGAEQFGRRGAVFEPGNYHTPVQRIGYVGESLRHRRRLGDLWLFGPSKR